jgi:hypothetical protein
VNSSRFSTFHDLPWGIQAMIVASSFWHHFVQVVFVLFSSIHFVCAAKEEKREGE